MSKQSENVAWGIAAGVVFVGLTVGIAAAILSNGKGLDVALLAGVSFGISAAGAILFYKHAMETAGMEQSKKDRWFDDHHRPPDDFQDLGNG